MMSSRSKFGRFLDNMRRNVFSYKYIKHNILMTAIVVAMALCVFAVVSFGEKSDPLADELYANDSVTVTQSQAVMMEEDSVKLAMDAASPAGSYVSASDSVNVAAGQGSSTYVTSDVTEVQTTQAAVNDAPAAGDATTEDIQAETTEMTTEGVQATVAGTQDEADVAASLSGTVLYDGVCVQEGQSTDSAVLSMVNSGDTVSILVQDEGWVRVKLADGTTGYIGTEFLSIQ